MIKLTRIILMAIPIAIGMSLSLSAQVKTEKTETTDTVKSKTSNKEKKGRLASSAKVSKDTVKKSAYDKLFEKKNFTTQKSNFITLHRVGTSIYFEIPSKYFEREMLLSSTPTSSSDPTYSNMGYKTTYHVKFSFEDSTIYLKHVNSKFLCNPKESELKTALDEQSLDPIIESYKILAWSNDKKSVVIDMTKFFMSPNSYLPLFSSRVSIFSVLSKFKAAIPALVDMKAFDDNLTIKSKFAYEIDLKYGFYLLSSEDVTVVAARSLMLLPEDKMKNPRISDPRVGIFLTDRNLFSVEENDGIIPFAVAHRWRLEPKDEKAYKQGKLVEPKKPIVFYIDNNFPEEWKNPVRKGVLRWNAAFEKIGFKNAVQVKDFPKNDTTFDADNLKYSCVRYVPAGIANAMGPSYVDPTTGEIISASVLIYSDVSKLINSWRFVQTAQVDPRVRAMKMPKDIMDESIAYVVAHEIGHTLGFMHNMASSAAIPVDSLRSANYTRKYGTTMSIMDYARYNYVAQPGDKNVRLLPPDLGPWDEFLIKWNYQYFPEAKNSIEERAKLQKLVDEKAGNPIYRYGRQQIAGRYDPSAMEEDLGDDPMKAGDYGIKNLKYILSNMDQWIKNDDENLYAMAIYSDIINQYYRYLRNVMYNIGGVYLTDVKPGTSDVQNVVSVPKATQKASLQWLLKNFREIDWLTDNAIAQRGPLSLNGSSRVQYAVTISLNRLYNNVLVSAHVAKDPYTMEEFYDDIYNEVFVNAVKRGTLTSGEKLLQNAFANEISERFGTKVSLSLFLTDEEDLFAPSLDEIIAYGLDETGLVKKFETSLRKIANKPGNGVENTNLVDKQLNSIGYNWQRQVPVRAIDNSDQVLHGFATKIRNFLKENIHTIKNPKDKEHYEALIFFFNRRLNENN